MMTDLVSQFQGLVSQATLMAPGGSVELLIAALPPETARLLKICAIPHHFTPQILRVLEPDLSDKEAQARYDELSALPVCIYLEERVAIHDEARRYLFTQWLKPEHCAEFAAISRRLAAYFENAARSAQGMLKQYLERDAIFHLLGADQPAGFSKFERQWTEDYLECGLSGCKSLLGLVREYREVLTPERTAWLDYYEACFAAETGAMQPAIKALEALRQQASAQAANLQVMLLLKHGQLLGRLGRWKEGAALFHNALTLAELSSMEARIQCIRHELGVAYREQGELDKALINYQGSLDRAKEQGNPSAIAQALNGLGNLALALGEYKQALAHFADALEWTERAGNNFRKAEIYNNLGMAHALERAWNKAETRYRESLNIKEQAGDTRGRASSLNNLVQVYQNIGQPERALDSGSQAAELFLEVHDYMGAALSKRNVARILHRLGEHEASHQAYTKAAELFRKGGSNTQAEEVEKEISVETTGMPWWVWTAIVLLCLLVVLVVIVEKNGIMT